jgi:hypothetical protein
MLVWPTFIARFFLPRIESKSRSMNKAISKKVIVKEKTMNPIMPVLETSKIL